jgi:PAS domain S-box-containing protein
MKYPSKTKQELLEEISVLKQRIQELKKLETERKRTEEALKKSEALLLEMINQVPDCVYQFYARPNGELGLYYVSGKSEQVVGLKPGLEGFFERFIALVIPEHRDGFIKSIEKAVKEASVWKYEGILQKPSGEKIWFSGNSIPSPRENEMVFNGIMQDITERKRAEEALREFEGKYRNILEKIEDGYFEVDLAGNFTFFNPSLCRILGYPREEMRGMNNRAYMDAENATKCFRAFTEVYMTGVPTKGFEWEIIRKDGARGYLEVSISIIVGPGEKPTGFCGIARDVTERKKAEERQKETLESLRKALGTTIQVMVSAVEMRDSSTAGHQIRAADLARTITTEMGLPQEKIDIIRMAGSVHDIGKLFIPAEILSKPAKLSEMEFALIKEHAQKGYEILLKTQAPWSLAETVYQHHERMDGSGYPRNLKGEEILIEARILAVADVVEAMASHRPCRPALGMKAALEEIEKNKETLYDATVVDACLKVFRENGYQFKEK